MSLPSVGDAHTTRIGKGEVEDVNVLHFQGSGKFFVQYLIKNAVELLCEDMRRNIKKDFDNLVIIDGIEGGGKSTLAYRICRTFDPDFDIETGYIYNVKEFWKGIQGDTRGKCFWLDEGSIIANNRDWNTQDNKDFVQILETMRSKGWTIVMCIPSFQRLDVYIREFRSRYHLHCAPTNFPTVGYMERGTFEIQKRNPYGTMEHVCYGRFDPMPEDLFKRYKELKDGAQDRLKEKVGEDKSPGAKYKAKYEEQCKRVDQLMFALHESGGLPDEEIMKLCGIENHRTYLNRLSKVRNSGKSEGEMPEMQNVD